MNQNQKQWPTLRNNTQYQRSLSSLPKTPSALFLSPLSLYYSKTSVTSTMMNTRQLNVTQIMKPQKGTNFFVSIEPSQTKINTLLKKTERRNHQKLMHNLKKKKHTTKTIQYLKKQWLSSLKIKPTNKQIYEGEHSPGSQSR